VIFEEDAICAWCALRLAALAQCMSPSLELVFRFDTSAYGVALVIGSSLGRSGAVSGHRTFVFDAYDFVGLL
jgi:hypothetical protein